MIRPPHIVVIAIALIALSAQAVAQVEPARKSIKANTDAYSVVYSFAIGAPGGTDPQFTLLQASNGNYYGATYTAGANNAEVCNVNAGCGTVFELTPTGTVTTLYSFCSKSNCSDGFAPEGIIQGGDGNFYGITDAGGADGGNCSQGVYGCGTLFKVTPAGELTTLHVFCSESDCTDGAAPLPNLVQGSDGSFYGVTASGGNSAPSACAFGFTPDGGCGTIFKVTPSGVFTTLYAFCSQTGCADGLQPSSGLVQGSDGSFYGTAAGGKNGDGILFRVTSSGSLTVLYAFCGKSQCADGNSPNGSLVEGSDGNFYGTTALGGVKDGNCTISEGCGTVFKTTTSGAVTTLYSFCSLSNCADGIEPTDGLFLGSDGNFYGLTFAGGANENSCGDDICGTVFSTSSSGGLTTLYSFCSQTDCADGYYPQFNSILQSSEGTLFGEADGGGAYDQGVVFELSPSPSLAAPVQLSFSDSTVHAGNSVTLDWSVLNAFSTTMQQCYAFVQSGGTLAGTWTGLQTGTLANNLYSGSATITPTTAGTYTYALTCGGIESGFATLTVDASTTPDIEFTSVTHNMGSVSTGNNILYGVQLTNNTNTAFPFALTLSTTASPNPYSYQTNCGTSVAGGAKCEIVFKYAPVSGDIGTETATWTLAPNGMTFGPADGGTLTGVAVPTGSLNLTTSVHNFGDVTVGTNSPAYGTVLTNSYDFPVTLSYSTSGNTTSFTTLTNCGATLYAGQSCNGDFTFTPKAAGFVTESIGLSASYEGNPVTITSLGSTVTGITLKGTGE